MSKQSKGKQVSKGSRISCKTLTKQAITAVAVVEPCTNMRQAFMAVRIKQASELSALVVDRLAKGMGVLRKNRGWQADVTARTTKQLIKDGVFA